jgi:hypothetical protein
MTPNWIPLSDPDVSPAELDAVSEVLKSPRLSSGPTVAAFEAEFASYVGRKHAVAVASGTTGLLLCLRAYDVGPGHEVIVSPYSWHQIAHAVALAGATPVFADIDYWSGTLAPEKAQAKITPRTHAIVAGNTNGHPAAWSALRDAAQRHGVLLIEDSTEAIGSRYQGKLVGSFGDCAIFDFSQPGALVCGEGGMVVTDDADVARALRQHRQRRLDERFSVSVTARLPYQAAMSDVTAALGLAQLRRIDAILARRKVVEAYYYDVVRSFEGIKDPYIAPDVSEVHWFLYQVHLGTRFTKSSRDAIVQDMHTESVEAAAYCNPLHLQRFYLDRGHRKGECLVTEKVADRVLALPFHAHLQEEHVRFIVQTAKDASINVGAGSAIYL